MSGDPFSSSRYCIRHGHRRINELEGYLIAFRESNPYRHVIDRDLEGGFKSHKIKLVKEVPEPVAGTIFDAANSLRCSLDQAGYAIAIAIGKSGTAAHFPFGNDDKLSASVHCGGSSKQLPQEVFDTMIAAKPYKRGNRFLWGVNEIANTHKHEGIVQPTTVRGRQIITGKRYKEIPMAPWPPRWDAVKNEMEIGRTPLDSTDEVKFHGTFVVGIAHPDVFGNSPAMDVLLRMVQEVETVLNDVEQVARRFGFIR